MVTDKQHRQFGASPEAYDFVESLRKSLKLRYSRPIIDRIISKVRKNKTFLAELKADLKK